MVVKPVDFYEMSPDDIVKYLPGKDCNNCGYDDCKGFAVALSKDTVKVEKCPEMELRMKESLDGTLSIKLEVHEADFSFSTVPETLIEINSPTPDSPILVTGNSGVTLYVLKLIFKKTPNVSTWIVPTDTKGYTIDHAAAMHLMTPMTVMKGLMNAAMSGKVNHRNIILPGLCEGIERQVEMITKWRTEIGPKSGFELPTYLVKKSEKDDL